MIYVSQRPPEVTDEVIIEDIVLPAGMKNRRLEITGCLWFSDDRFLQLLEGPPRNVLNLYATIEKDRRHTNIHLLSSSTLAARSFSRWNMRALSSDEKQEIDELIRYYVPSTRAELKPGAQPTRSLLEQVRSYLVRLAQSDPRSN